MHDSLDLPELYDQALEYEQIVQGRNNSMLLLNGIVFLLVGVFAISYENELPIVPLILLGVVSFLRAENLTHEPAYKRFVQISMQRFYIKILHDKPKNTAASETEDTDGNPRNRTNAFIDWIGLAIIGILVIFAWNGIAIIVYYLLAIPVFVLYFLRIIVRIQMNESLSNDSKLFIQHAFSTVAILTIIFALLSYPVYVILQQLFFTLILNNQAFAQTISVMLTATLIRFLLNKIYMFPVRYVDRKNRQGNHKQAVTFIYKLRQWRPYQIEWAYLHAYTLMTYGDEREACEIFEQVLNIPPGGMQFCAGLLVNYAIASDDHEKSLLFFETAIEMVPSSYSNYANFAYWYHKYDMHPERAMEISEQAVRLLALAPDKDKKANNSSRSYTIGTHAVALAKVGRFEEAHTTIQQEFERLAKSDTSLLAWLHFKLGMIFQAESKIAEAIQEMNTVLELVPTGQCNRRATNLLKDLTHTQS